MEIKLSLNKDVNYNANFYFEKAKKLKRKIKGVDEIIEKTQKEIIKFEEQKEEYLKKKEEKKKIEVHKKKEWYEKFRYTFTSSGFLVVIGKDAGTNEILIKKHTEENDIIFHTQAPGSPFGIVKSAISKSNSDFESTVLLSKTELEEVAQFICCFSSQWKKGYGTADAFWVFPKQVSKKAESGEFMSRGSFMIRGKKNIIKNVVLRIYLGIRKEEIEIGDEKLEIKNLFSGSENSCKKYCNNNYIKLEPGNDNYKKLTKEIKKRLKSHIEDLPKYIPNGCRILKK